MQGNEKYIGFAFPSYGGMINHLMELELRVGLAYLSDRTLVCLDKYPIAPMQEDHVYGRYRQAGLLDLFDIPVNYMSVAKVYKKGFDSLFNLPWKEEAIDSYYIDGNLEDYSESTIKQFTMGRSQRWEFPDNDYDSWSCYTPRTFCNYSFFFLLKPRRRKRFLRTMSQLRPKAPYLTLAKKITAQFGRFNAIHVRRGDFKSWWVKNPEPAGILSCIEKFMTADKPLLICSDEYLDSAMFDPIIKKYPKAILLDKLIEKDYESELNQLPYSDASVAALLTILVAANAEEFAGTPFSTFTGYIHRLRMRKNADSLQRFVHNPFAPSKVKMREGVFVEDKEGAFSWNRCNYDLPESAKGLAWFREWPEAVR